MPSDEEIAELVADKLLNRAPADSLGWSKLYHNLHSQEALDYLCLRSLNGGFCTRRKGHTGIHVATRIDDVPFVWEK